MATITDLQSTDNGADSMDIINDNFDNLNNDKVEAEGSIDTVTEIMKKLNPVGTIREFNVSDNPATLLGFGTWAEYGTGKVTVGIDTSDTDFDTVDETGGSKTKNISHSHRTASGFDGTYNYNWHNGSDNPIFGSDVVSSVSKSTISHSTLSSGGVRVARTEGSGSTTQDVMNPYTVVYRWVRTA